MRPLTSRQLQVAKLTIEGLSIREIGKEMGITPRTVKDYLMHIYRRLDIDDRWNKKIRLVYVLWKTGLIETL